MENNLRKSGESDEEYLDRMIALEKKEIARDEFIAKSIIERKSMPLKRLEVVIDSLGEANTKKKRKANRQLAKEALQISYGVHIS